MFSKNNVIQNNQVFIISDKPPGWFEYSKEISALLTYRYIRCVIVLLPTFNQQNVSYRSLQNTKWSDRSKFNMCHSRVLSTTIFPLKVVFSVLDFKFVSAQRVNSIVWWLKNKKTKRETVEYSTLSIWTNSSSKKVDLFPKLPPRNQDF